VQQVLVYSDSLSWGMVPTTRRRLPFDAPQGIATELGCSYFDAGSVIAASPADGIHLDAEQHDRLGKSLAGFLATLPGFATPSER
jgi:hypothetical protein